MGCLFDCDRDDEGDIYITEQHAAALGANGMHDVFICDGFGYQVIGYSADLVIVEQIDYKDALAAL